MNRYLALLGLAATLLLLCASPPAQAQSLHLQHFDSPATVVEAGSFHLIATVGAPTLGTPVLLQRALNRIRTAEAPLETAEALPTTFSLSPNYPNPFNPTTTIRFALPEAATVRLTVYDVLGRQVQLLVDEQRPSGRHEVGFEATRLPSGLYFYRIEAGAFTAVRRMLLVK